MRRRNLLRFALTSLVLLSAVLALGIPGSAMPLAQASQPLPESEEPAAVPGLMFVENVGQFDPQARFQVRGQPGVVWLAEGAIWITLVESQAIEEPSPEEPVVDGIQSEEEAPRLVNLKISFPDANTKPGLESFQRLDTNVSYYRGSDPDQWFSQVPAWGAVRYVDLFPGVNLEITGESGGWVWRLVEGDSAPNRAAMSDLRMRVEGADAVSVLPQNDAGGGQAGLRISTEIGDLVWPLLTVDDRLAEGQVVTVEAAGNGFDVLAPVTGGSPAAISSQDSPESLVFSTYLGGSGSDAAQDMTLDTAGAMYVTGSTASPDFPTTTGGTLGGDWDIFVTKMVKGIPSASLEYSTYVGGSYYNVNWGSAESAYGIAVDDSGIAYVTGETRSSNFPTTTNAFDTSFNGDSYCTGPNPVTACLDAVVFMLDGQGGLSYSTFLGGSGSTAPSGWRMSGDDGGRGVAELGGVMYLTGWTQSENFPTTSGAYDRTYANPATGLWDDVFLVKLDPAGNGSADLLYSTYVGGGQEEHGEDIAITDGGVAYVTGYARGSQLAVNSDFPITPGAFDDYLWQSDYDAFMFELDPAGNGSADLLYSTFLGGYTWDEGHAIALDDSGDAYVTGRTNSSNFPTTTGAYDRTCGVSSHECPSGIGDAFVSQLNPGGNDSADLRYSSFLGGGSFENSTLYQGDIGLDALGNVFLVGGTRSDNFPTTSKAYDSSFDGDSDVFVSYMELAGNGGDDLIYSSYLGGSGDESGNGLTPGKGTVFVTGYTNSGDFPTTSDAYDRVFNGVDDVFVAELATLEPTTLDVDLFVESPPWVYGVYGGRVEIPVSYGNRGLTVARSVRLTATLDSFLTYANGPGSVPPDYVSGNILAWNLPDLAFGDGGNLTVPVTLPVAISGTVTLGTQFPVTFTIGSLGPEFDPSDNQSVTIVTTEMPGIDVYLPLMMNE